MVKRFRFDGSGYLLVYTTYPLSVSIRWYLRVTPQTTYVDRPLLWVCIVAPPLYFKYTTDRPVSRRLVPHLSSGSSFLRSDGTDVWVPTRTQTTGLDSDSDTHKSKVLGSKPVTNKCHNNIGYKEHTYRTRSRKIREVSILR